MADFDVVVCGLGPVGQLLALLLGDRGIRTLVVDQAEDVYELPRAAVIDDEVLRILQSVGLDAAVLADAQVQRRASIVTDAGRAVEVLSARTGALGHPPLISIHQPTMERTMLAALAARDQVELRRGVELTEFSRRAGEVDVTLRPVNGGRSSVVTAGYLIGCDGAGSAVRSQLKIPFEGSTAPQRWVVVDARVDRPLARVKHPHFVGDASRPAVTLPMSPGRHRWEWMVHPGEDPAPLLQAEAVRAAIEPWLDGEVAEIERAVVYTFHTRTARRWREGRVFLAGDSAHLMPPFAGQGFSAGARDVSNLAWKLAAVIGGGPEPLLDSYEAERRPHLAAMQRTANLMGSLVQSTSPARVPARDLVLHAIDGTPIQRWVAGHVKPLPSYGDGLFSQRPSRLPSRRTIGRLFPQSARLDDRLGSGWAAVTSAPLPAAALRAAGFHVVDPGPDQAWLHEHGCTWALLRPDRFVYACGASDDIAAASDARRWLPAAPRLSVAE